MRRVVPRQIAPAGRGVSFKRSWFADSWAFNNVTTPGFWRRFVPDFNDIPNHQEYRNLFDQYRVTGVKVTFHPRNLLVQAPAAGTGLGPTNNQVYITYAANPNEDYQLIPSGLYSSANYNQFLEEMGSHAKTRALTRPISYYYKPRIISDEGGGVNMKACPWIMCNSAGDPVLYGSHVWLHDYNFGALNSAQFGVDIQYTMYFQCRGQN